MSMDDRSNDTVSVNVMAYVKTLKYVWNFKKLDRTIKLNLKQDN